MTQPPPGGPTLLSAAGVLGAVSFDGLDGIRALGLTLGTAVVLVLAVFAASGAALAFWALSTSGRHSAGSGGAGGGGPQGSPPGETRDITPKT